MRPPGGNVGRLLEFRVQRVSRTFVFQRLSAFHVGRSAEGFFRDGP